MGVWCGGGGVVGRGVADRGGVGGEHSEAGAYEAGLEEGKEVGFAACNEVGGG